MIDHVKEFENAVKGWGYNRLDLNKKHRLFDGRLLAEVKASADEVIRKHCDARGPKMPHIHFDFIDSPRIQAWAWYSRPIHSGYIGMYAGTVFLLYDIFYRMMSHPKILPTIGDASLESVKFPSRKL